MKYYNDITEIDLLQPAAISLGKFDGLHIGHRLLMDKLAEAKKEGLASVAITFDLPPNALDDSDFLVLSTREEKEWIFEKAGVDILLVLPFTKELRNMEPEEFLDMLTTIIPVKRIVAGTDFRFGKNRRGDYRTLIEYGEKSGYHADIVEKIQDNGRDISSTRIREEVVKGNILEANRLLGHLYFSFGTVIHGNHLGRTIQVPTANIRPEEGKLLPPNGGYISITEIDGKSYAGISNIGYKPTVGESQPFGIETYLFDFDEDIYGKKIRVSLVDFIRPEKKFDSFEELKIQIKKDIDESRDKIRDMCTVRDGQYVYECGFEEVILSNI